MEELSERAKDVEPTIAIRGLIMNKYVAITRESSSRSVPVHMRYQDPHSGICFLPDVNSLGRAVHTDPQKRT